MGLHQMVDKRCDYYDGTWSLLDQTDRHIKPRAVQQQKAQTPSANPPVRIRKEKENARFPLFPLSRSPEITKKKEIIPQ